MNLPINYKDSHWSTRRLVREEYIRRQQGKCFYCGTFLNEPPSEEVTKKYINKKLFPKNFFKYSVHLHHDHDSGMTIGAVHSYCNAVLWQYYGK